MADRATVTELRPAHRSGGRVSVLGSVDGFLATPRCNQSPNTQRAYAGTLHRVATFVGGQRDLDGVVDDEIAEALDELWGTAAPSTWNRNRAAVSSWLAWCAVKMKWSAPAVPASCERRHEPDVEGEPPDKTEIDRVTSRRDIPLRERLLWRMLYESASRATAVLELNVEDLDVENRRAPVRIKGGDTRWITWGRGTAMLLPRYLKGRSRGPLFLSNRVPGPARRAAAHRRDICPETGRQRLGYDRARTLIKQNLGVTLHWLRHAAATHLGEAGTDSTVIMAKTHHRSIRSVARYTRPGLAAAAAATELLDPPRRRA